jgi:outer membrane protein OmpA-like peptidoglycan-associated protein
VLRPGQAATLPGRFLFDFDKATLTPKGVALVKALVANLRGNQAVSCEGYTDYAGDARHELQLSRQRSVAVCTALTAYGAKVRTATRGYGGTKPVVVGGRAQTRHENRRVVVVVDR